MAPIVTPAPLAIDLLSEWQQCTGFVRAPAHEPVWNQVVTKLAGICEMLEKTADVNIDIDDLRASLLPYSTIRIGSAEASGLNRALQLAQAALHDAYSWVLGPVTTTLGTHALLLIESHPTAELEMEELTVITEHIQYTVSEETEVIFAHDQQTGLPAELRLHLLLGFGPPIGPFPKWQRPLRLRPEDVFPAAVQLIKARRQVSGSLLQRCLGLGYNRTCQLLEELEMVGVVRRQDGGFELVKK